MINRILLSITILASSDYENKMIEMKRLLCRSLSHNAALVFSGVINPLASFPLYRCAITHSQAVARLAQLEPR